MGLFNSGNNTMIDTTAHKINVGIIQLSQELDKSNTLTPMARGLVIAIKKEIQTLINQVGHLSENSRQSLKIKVNGNKLSYAEFIWSIRMFSNDLNSVYDISLF